MATNYRIITQLNCFGQSPRNDVKQLTIRSLAAEDTPVMLTSLCHADQREASPFL